MSELLPCPFCGNPTPTAEYAGFCDPRYYVKCYDCGTVVHGAGNSPEHAAEMWNRRASPPAQTGEVALRDAADFLRGPVSNMSPAIFQAECKHHAEALEGMAAIQSREDGRDARDAARYRFARDEMDDSDFLHMFASGRAHWDSTIDSALSQSRQQGEP